jgi:hypothetical protein
LPSLLKAKRERERERRERERESESLGDKEKERMKLQKNFTLLPPGALAQSCFLGKAGQASLPMVIVSFSPQAHFTKIGSDRQGALLLSGSWEGNTKHYIKHCHQASSFGLH